MLGIALEFRSAVVVNAEGGYVFTPTWQKRLAAVFTQALSFTGAPAHSNSLGVAGMVAYDANFLYICIQSKSHSNPAIWKRIALSAF